MILTNFEEALLQFGLKFAELYHKYANVEEFTKEQSDKLISLAVIPDDQIKAIEEVIMCDNPSQSARNIAKKWLVDYLYPREEKEG